MYKSIKAINPFGMKISIFQKKELEKYLRESIIKDNKLVCYGYSFAIIALFKKYPELFYYSQKSDIIVTDGRLLYLFLKLAGFGLKDDLSIPNLVNIVLEISNKNDFKIMIIGSDKETNNLAVNNIRNKYAGITNIKGIDGYFSSEEEQKIVDDINKFRPDVLLIGISSPKKERLAIEWKEKTSAKLIIPCGGMIDVLAGKVSQSPVLIKKLGLASLYRLFQEPSRLFRRQLYIYTFILFRFIPALLFKTFLSGSNKFDIQSYFGFENSQA